MVSILGEKKLFQIVINLNRYSVIIWLSLAHPIKQKHYRQFYNFDKFEGSNKEKQDSIAIAQ